MLPQYLHNHCEGIDAAMFSGDVLWDDKARAELRVYVERWLRAIDQHEQEEKDEHRPA